MSYEYFIVDAFTETPFGGVPVAVFPNAEFIPPAYRSVLCEETGASDAVFVQSITSAKTASEDRFGFEFFNAVGRTLPSAHTLIAGLAVLNETKSLAQAHGTQSLKIETPEDCIEAFVDTSVTACPYLLKQTLTPTLDNFVPIKQTIANIIGLSDSDIADTNYNCLIASCGVPYLFVPLKSYHAVREAHFNNGPWAASSLPTSLVDKILLFAPSTDQSGAHFHTRLLERNPVRGTDPAVGETLPAFAAYLCQQKHVQKGTQSITVRRGPNDGRQSHLHLEIDNREEQPLGLRIGGSAIVAAKGVIFEH